jgi:hypothetical protein
MSTPPQDGWPSRQQWDSTASDEGRLYGQPFDPTVSSPTQQPPPPGWEQGTWTHHGGPAPSKTSAQTWLLVRIAVVVVLVIAGVLLLVA